MGPWGGKPKKTQEGALDVKKPILNVYKNNGSDPETMVESTKNIRLPIQLNSS